MPAHRRVTKFSTLQLLKIAKMLYNGFQDDELAFYFNCESQAIKAIRLGHQNPEVRRAVYEYKNKDIEKIKAGHGKLSGLIWFLERRWPRQFARPDVQLSLSAGPTTNNTLVVSAEVAEALVSKSKQVNFEIDSLINQKMVGPPQDSE